MTFSSLFKDEFVYLVIGYAVDTRCAIGFMDFSQPELFAGVQDNSPQN